MATATVSSGSLPVGAGAAEIGARLRALSNPVRAEQDRRYLKSRLTHLGASVPDIRRVAKEFARAHPGLGREALLAVVHELWAAGIHEHRAAAVELLDLGAGLLDARDLARVEDLIRESGTWALADNLAARVAGALVERHPELVEVLDRWAVDADLWVRRSALLALLVPLRRGEGDFERFGRYADALLGEKEFFLRKAIGWVLRDTARKRPKLVASWLMPRAARASALTVREAVRHLPPGLREAVLAARARGLDAPPEEIG